MHAIEQWSFDEFRKLLEHSVNSLDHFPSISQIEKIADELNISGTKWKYLEVENCYQCGGVGWHWFQVDDKKGVCACNECDAGRNMQKAPKPHIRKTMKEFSGAIYSSPGKHGNKVLNDDPAGFSAALCGLCKAIHNAMVGKSTRVLGLLPAISHCGINEEEAHKAYEEWIERKPGPIVIKVKEFLESKRTNGSFPEIRESRAS